MSGRAGVWVIVGCFLACADIHAQSKKSAPPEKSKDSPIVAATRKKLETMVTVDFVDAPLREVLDELKSEAGFSYYFAMGVSGNQKVTYSAKNKSVKDVLDEIFKPLGLGYVIHRKDKEGDRYEGWLRIVQGTQRGDDVSPSQPKPSKSTPEKKKSPKGS